MSAVRCAIYTRKSSEEGLEQSFNSLDAQREACEAYVLSQKSLGWQMLPTLYDDGGYSGGKLQRPALLRLLDDIRARRVDIVVVYKVDRLTRSLADFAKIVEVFDGQGVSFVSVTQAFNTTSSMGRLTLNVLLSFAQFEREVTGERIRDKIAASKAKGMWMGGYPPLGYNAKDRTLLVVPEEADTVRLIFDRYLALGSVRALRSELEANAIRSKQHRGENGQVRGGTPFSRGALFHLLKNRIYVGDIVHKKSVYPGLHDAIVPLEIFQRVQQSLALKASRSGTREKRSPAPLAGLVFDSSGMRMTPVHAYGRSARRYRYYLSPFNQAGDDPDQVTRVAAGVLEEVILERSRQLLGSQTAQWPEIIPRLSRVEVRSDGVTLCLKPSASTSEPFGEELGCRPLGDRELVVRIAACMRPRKGSTRITAPAARVSRSYLDRPLIAALKRAHRELALRGINSPSAINSHARGLEDPYLRRIVRLAFLAPDIQYAILTGRQPTEVTLKRLTRGPFPLDWEVQRKQLAFC